MKTVNEIICGLFKISSEECGKDMHMQDVLSWDSLTHMDLIVALEEEYNIRLSGDDIAEMQSLDAIRSIVAKYHKGS